MRPSGQVPDARANSRQSRKRHTCIAGSAATARERLGLHQAHREKNQAVRQHVMNCEFTALVGVEYNAQKIRPLPALESVRAVQLADSLVRRAVGCIPLVAHIDRPLLQGFWALLVQYDSIEELSPDRESVRVIAIGNSVRSCSGTPETHSARSCPASSSKVCIGQERVPQYGSR